MNKNILIAFLIIIIALLAFLAFKPKPTAVISNESVPKQIETTNNPSNNPSTPMYKSSPSEFGTTVLYDSSWTITPGRYGSSAMQAKGETALVGYSFALQSGANIIWGGPQSSCSKNEPQYKFTYGESTMACIKGLSATIDIPSAQKTLSIEDKKAFGDFVLKNQ
jgi:hypothetical protein